MSSLIGVDPGLSGAIAAIDDDGLHLYEMPVLEYTVTGGKIRKEVNCGKVREILRKFDERQAYMELISGYGSQAFTEFRFGEAYGMMKACMALTSTPYALVPPRTWKKYFGLTRDKDHARELAQQKFPERAKSFARKKDDGKAEAALIALYGLEQSGLNL